MKKYVLAAIFIAATIVTAFSQKVITKKMDVTGKKVEMKFDFADSIRIEAWSKNTVELEVSVNIDNNRFNEYYKLNENSFSGDIDLIEKIDFEAIKKIKGSGNNLGIAFTLPMSVAYEPTSIIDSICLAISSRLSTPNPRLSLS